MTAIIDLPNPFTESAPSHSLSAENSTVAPSHLDEVAGAAVVLSSTTPGMALTHATRSEPLLIPRFLNSAARQTQHASDGNALRTTGLAITRGGVAEPCEQRDETDKTDLPKHDEPRDHRVAIEPELAGVVISINSENVERTS